MCKIILEPIWIYGVQLWCTASTSNIEILQALLMIVDAHRFMPNTVIRRNLQISTVKEKSAATTFNTVFYLTHTQTT
jgi:hypothetical protein